MLLGVPQQAVMRELDKIRDQTIKAMLVEASFALASFGLGGRRSALTKVSIALNTVLFFVSIIGLAGAVKVNPAALIAHAMTVIGLVSVFILYMLMVSLFSNSGDKEGIWILAIIFIFILVDVAMTYYTISMARQISKIQRRIATDPAAFAAAPSAAIASDGQSGGAAQQDRTASSARDSTEQHRPAASAGAYDMDATAKVPPTPALYAQGGNSNTLPPPAAVPTSRNQSVDADQPAIVL
jgi:hypothetical protein